MWELVLSTWTFSLLSRATIWLISAVEAYVFYLLSLSVRLSVFLLFLEKKTWLVPFAIRATASRGWTMRSGERPKDSGKPDRESTMRVCAFFKRMMDPEEHCLKLVTGGKTFRRLGFSWHATVKGWPEESRNPQHVYQELPADIFFMFHMHSDLFSVPSFLLCLCWTLHDFKCHWQTNFKVVASYPKAKRFDLILQRFRRQANVATHFNS